MLIIFIGIGLLALIFFLGNRKAKADTQKCCRERIEQTISVEERLELAEIQPEEKFVGRAQDILNNFKGVSTGPYIPSMDMSFLLIEHKGYLDESLREAEVEVLNADNLLRACITVNIRRYLSELTAEDFRETRISHRDRHKIKYFDIQINYFDPAYVDKRNEEISKANEEENSCRPLIRLKEPASFFRRIDGDETNTLFVQFDAFVFTKVKSKEKLAEANKITEEAGKAMFDLANAIRKKSDTELSIRKFREFCDDNAFWLNAYTDTDIVKELWS